MGIADNSSGLTHPFVLTRLGEHLLGPRKRRLPHRESSLPNILETQRGIADPRGTMSDPRSALKQVGNRAPVDALGASERGLRSGNRDPLGQCGQARNKLSGPPDGGSVGGDR
jgi:hypothetical protein